MQQPIDDNNQFLMTTGVAQELGVSAQTVILWNRSGRLPAIRLANGVRLYRRDDIERIKQEREDTKRA
jgi:DNA-binding transcriptional MerR regulator